MIIKKSQFENLKLTFESKKDPLTKLPFSIKFDQDDFSRVEGESLFKLAARAHLNESNNNSSPDIAVKYQVLSSNTAFIGVIKQNDKVIGEIKEVQIQKPIVPQQAEEEYKSAGIQLMGMSIN